MDSKKRWKNKDFVIMAKPSKEDVQKLKQNVSSPTSVVPVNTYKSDFEIIRREEMDTSLAIIKFKKTKPEAELPIRGTFGSAGYELCAFLDEDITIQPNECVKIPLGFSTSFRSNYVALVFSKTGLAEKYGLVVNQGTMVIDSNYRGEWYVALRNQSNQPQLVRSGDRIAQLIVQPICRVKAIEVDDLNETKRGDDDFGSTGISNS